MKQRDNTVIVEIDGHRRDNTRAILRKQVEVVPIQPRLRGKKLLVI